ncbi:hypothetical protein BKA69DRAFT_146866 [Paraphysoderma sedebokerense]|nr:hypothetical protein BKA69DRAFT_146866 [Paraphysoderma sedebokerense]
MPLTRRSKALAKRHAEDTSTGEQSKKQKKLHELTDIDLLRGREIQDSVKVEGSEPLTESLSLTDAEVMKMKIGSRIIRLGPVKAENEHGHYDEEDAKEAKGTTKNINEIFKFPTAPLDEPLLEEGHIFFFYRPKVERHEAHDLSDVQRMYMALVPFKKGQTDTSESLVRLIVVAKKKLPETDQRARYWGFVLKVSEDIEQLAEYLKEETYETSTRGTRHLESCRPLGEGVYGIVKHQDHTHLAYVLEIPHEPGEVQKAFNVRKEGSFILSVKNPQTSNPMYAGLGPEKKAHYPEQMEQLFAGRRFIATNPPSFLNFEGCELLFIGSSHDIVEELGSVGEEIKNEEIKEEEDSGINLKDAKSLDEKVFADLHFKKGQFPTESLHGLWV